MATKSKAKADSSELVAAALAEHGFPGRAGPGLCFTSEGDALFARGYPAMRLLSEDALPDDVAFRRAEEALDAIDPALRITVPRVVARRYLLGHRVGTGLFLDVAHQPQNAQLKEERAALMRSDRPIEVALLEEALGAHGVSMGDTYSSWRWPKALYLYEAFLGTEVVARTLVRHLVREADDLSRWGFAGQDPGRTNAAPHYLALTLPWLFLRLTPAVVDELRSELLLARAPSDAPGEPRAYLALLRRIGKDPAVTQAGFALDLALSDDDPAALSALVSASAALFVFHPGRIAWKVGTACFAKPIAVSGHDLPRLVDQIAPLKDPGVVRLVAFVASQRAGKKAAAEWLSRHAAYARPILGSLAALADPKEKKAAEAALTLLNDETPVVVKPPTPEELEREIAAIFAALRKKLVRAKDDEQRKTLIREAYERYTEARAATGDPIPDAYFTHRFHDFDCAEWAMLAVDAID